MKKNLFILTVLIVALVTVGDLFMVPVMKQDALKDEKEELAISLGVNLQDYPCPETFPTNCFYGVLKPKMTLDEVH